MNRRPLTDTRPRTEWASVRIGDSLKLINGRAFKPTEWKKNGRPIVRIQNLNNPEAPYNYFEGDLPEKFLLDEGDLLFAWSGTPGTSFGAHIWRGGEAWLNQHIFKVEFDETQFDKSFLQLAINQNLAEYIRAAHGGAGLAHITKGRFEESELPQPDIPEQQSIVAEIEKQFTRLDAGVTALRRVQANLKRYRAAVLKAACEGRLVSTEAELAKAESRKFETGEELLTRILTERRKNWQGRGKCKEPAGPDLADLPSLSKGWTWATADQLTSVITDGEHITPERSEFGVLLLSARNVLDGRISVEDVDYVPQHEYDRIAKRLVIAPGDVLLSCSGSVGRSAVVPEGLLFTLVRSVAVLKPLAGMGKFLSIALRSPLLKRQIAAKQTQTAQANIFQGKIKVLCLPLPSLAEQNRIVAEVERRLSVLEELEAVVSANVQRAARLRQSILQEAFAGKLASQEGTAAEPKVIKLPEARRMGRPNAHFARALLSAEIVHRLHGEPTFGRIKHQKIFHLCEHIAKIEEIRGQYHREAAGPLDNKLIYATEAELKKQKWYQEVPRDPFGHAYQPLAKAGGHRKYVEQYWSIQLPLVEKVIELMRTWDTNRCEIFCTTYAAWNDLILWGKESGESAILEEILEHWHESKRRFSRERWQKAIGWMREKGFVPTGFSKPTRKWE